MSIISRQQQEQQQQQTQTTAVFRLEGFSTAHHLTGTPTNAAFLHILLFCLAFLVISLKFS